MKIEILKRKKSWELFRICLLNSTANPAQFGQRLAPAHFLHLYFSWPLKHEKTMLKSRILQQSCRKFQPGQPRQLKTHISFLMFLILGTNNCYEPAYAYCILQMHIEAWIFCLSKRKKKCILAIVQNAVKDLQANAKLYTPSTTIN